MTHRIPQAILETLLTDQYGLKEAEEVLVTGCSSGGLAAYLHADRVYSTLVAAQNSDGNVPASTSDSGVVGSVGTGAAAGAASAVAPPTAAALAAASIAAVGLPSPLKKFKVAGVSGFFLLHDNIEGVAVYPTQMQNIFEISNSSSGVDGKEEAADTSTRALFEEGSVCVGGGGPGRVQFEGRCCNYNVRV